MGQWEQTEKQGRVQLSVTGSLTAIMETTDPCGCDEVIVYELKETINLEQWLNQGVQISRLQL